MTDVLRVMGHTRSRRGLRAMLSACWLAIRGRPLLLIAIREYGAGDTMSVAVIRTGLTKQQAKLLAESIAHRLGQELAFGTRP